MVSVNNEHKLSISVLIPLTDLRTIDETVSSVIKQKYSADEIIILRNDTKQLPESIEFIERSDTVHPFREVFIQKRGKGNALNIGISLSKCELICVLDADCILDDNALMNIVKHFSNEIVVAAGGRLAVMKRSENLLVRIQDYEYIRTFQITRNVFATLNAQCLISGAFGIFRKSSLIEVNGYDTDTVGEDMEMVLRLQNSVLKRSEGRIIYEPESVCYTGTPEALGRLFHQRDRWQRGLLDCLIKHANMLFNPMFGFLGMLVLPCQFVLELLGPLWSILYFVWPIFSSMFPKSWLIYIAYVDIELLIGIYAVFIDVDGNVLWLIKKLPGIVLFTLLEILIQVPVTFARLWGTISFPWRRLVW